MPHLAFVAAQPGLDAFTCPNCHAYAQHLWYNTQLVDRVTGAVRGYAETALSMCTRCHRPCMWLNDQMVWPLVNQAPPSDPDMPDVIRGIYEEAADVAARSPRAAAALLRLAIEQLCVHLECKSDHLDKAIGELVQRGLRSDVVQMLDVVRITGNNAVHPREIDVDQDAQLVPALFGLVNLIVKQVIGEPKNLAELWGAMPAGAREAAERRNAKAQTAD